MAEGRTITVTIDHIGSRGDGVAETANSPVDGPVYVPFSAPGDELEVTLMPSGKLGKGSFKGTIKRVVVAGEGRAEPVCRHFGSCGGCCLQHLTEAAYVDWIGERIITALSHQGISNVEIAAPLLSPPASRRRLSLKYLKRRGTVSLGYHQRASHELVDLDECPVARPELVALFAPLKKLIAALPQARDGDIILTSTGAGVNVVLSLRDEPDLAEREALVAFATSHGLAALYSSVDGLTEPVAEFRSGVVEVGGIAMQVPPGAFLQATAEGQDVLIAAVTGAVGDARAVADLFSGSGTFSLPLAKSARVHAVEGELRLLAALEQSANRAQGLKGLSVEHRDLFRRPLLPDELDKFAVVVFDPPRAGAKAQATEIAASTVPVVVGVSCNPNTFARDARTLIDGGYRLESIQPIDQFLWSHHVELVGIFRR